MVDEASRLSRASIMTTLSFLTPLLEQGINFAVAQREQVLRRGDDAELLRLSMFLIESQGGHRENEKRIGQVRTDTGRVSAAPALAGWRSTLRRTAA